MKCLSLKPDRIGACSINFAPDWAASTTFSDADLTISDDST